MRPPGVTGLTGGMTTDPHGRPPRRTSHWFWVLFFAGTVVLAFLAVLPIIATVFVAAVWGAGGSGSNK
jgi:hypothetical protein